MDILFANCIFIQFHRLELDDPIFFTITESSGASCVPFPSPVSPSPTSSIPRAGTFPYFSAGRCFPLSTHSMLSNARSLRRISRRNDRFSFRSQKSGSNSQGVLLNCAPDLFPSFSILRPDSITNPFTFPTTSPAPRAGSPAPRSAAGSPTRGRATSRRAAPAHRARPPAHRTGAAVPSGQGQPRPAAPPR